MSSTNYNLNDLAANQPKSSTWSALRSLIALVPGERRALVFALTAIILNTLLSLSAPLIMKYTIDHYILFKDYHGVLMSCLLLLGVYLLALLTIYLRTILMGGVGQRLLFTLRNSVFNKLLELPVIFFNQNKAGDLISRVNNDTDKINQFFSQSLMQFVSSFFIIIGSGIFLVAINWRLGLATLAPAALMWVFTKFVSPWVKKRNAANIKSVGGMSAEIQESLNNFKVVIAFNRRDYFRKRFDEANKQNYRTAIGAGLANNTLMPVYSFFASLGALIVLTFGIYLISTGRFTAGALISFFLYVNYFYDPLRQLAALWANFQVALAGWDRISHLLNLESDLLTLPADAANADTANVNTVNGITASGNGHAIQPLHAVPATPTVPEASAVPAIHAVPAGPLAATPAAPPLLEFRNVSFRYPDGADVLHDNSFRMETGKTYALVGPTGGGKTTTASLIARLYDPTSGHVYLNGRDIRSYSPQERSQKIGFILQEPFLFSGTVKDNILYGNEAYKGFSNEELVEVIRKANLDSLLTRFDAGLDTDLLSAGDSISLGQKQLVAFMRAVLRNPELLILDEATANIDTVTERLLEDILRKLPDTTTRVIIAHRLNTIENADEIFFVNAGAITRAGSLNQAVDMLLHGKRVS